MSSTPCAGVASGAAYHPNVGMAISPAAATSLSILQKLLKFSRANLLVAIVCNSTDNKKDVRCNARAFSTGKYSKFHSYFFHVIVKKKKKNKSTVVFYGLYS